MSGKTYCLLLNNDKVVKKLKGDNSDKLDKSDYVKLLNNEDIQGLKTSSKKDFIEGYVSIYTDNINIKHDSYQREKVMNKDVWIDTKPVTINKK